MGHPQPSTPMQVDYSTCDFIMDIKIQQNAPSQWKCGFIGCDIEKNKNNLTYFGKMVWETLGNILLNITCNQITKEWYDCI